MLLAKFQNIIVYLLCFKLCYLVSAFNLTILHNNDVHSHFAPITELGNPCNEPNNQTKTCFGGVARTAWMVKQIKSKTKNVLFLNAGDHFQGTIWYTLYKWVVVKKFVNMLNYDAMALGNHEFDDGVDGLIPFINATEPLPILSCNIDASAVPRLQDKIRRSVVVKIANRSIGIIGYTTPDTKFLTNAVPMLQFNDEITCIKEEVKKLEASGINILIALGHSGYAKDLDIARNVPELDVVIGGHTNTFLYTGPKPSIEQPVDAYPVVINHSNNRKTLVIEAFAFGKYLGKINLVFDDSGKVLKFDGNPILMSPETPEDPEVALEVRKFYNQIQENFTGVVGQSLVQLDGDCRIKECNLGNVIADSILNYYAKRKSNTTSGWTESAIALINGGNIRSGIDTRTKQGLITLEDVMTVLPFENSISMLTMSGKMMKRMLEHSVTSYDATGTNAAGRFLQVSGIIVKYNITRLEQHRVQNVFVRCSACLVPKFDSLKDNNIYKVLMPKFIAEGGDGYDFLQSKEVNQTEFQQLESEIFSEYLKEKSPIWTGIEKRIIITT